jgi:hypothetical protein
MLRHQIDRHAELVDRRVGAWIGHIVEVAAQCIDHLDQHVGGRRRPRHRPAAQRIERVLEPM